MLILASESDPVLFVATRDPAGVATFWRPATRAIQRPCQPWAAAAAAQSGPARPPVVDGGTPPVPSHLQH